jgi:hypothetical protein
MIVARRYAGAMREAGENPALPRNCKRGHSGRPLGVGRLLGRTAARDGLKQSLLASQETGANRYLKPLSRAKEDGMFRSLVVRFAISLLLFVPAFAGELQIKVLDPHSAAVAGAQVSLYRAGESAPLQVRTTSGEGLAIFNADTSAPLRVEVLAPGFAAARADVESSASTATVALQVASASETVIVTATRSPAPEQETASSVSLLTSDEITTMLPVAFSDALRFLRPRRRVALQHGSG